MEEQGSLRTGSLLSWANAAVQSKPSVESVWPDGALDELKKQSSEGCLLCSFDAWDEEEWD